MKRADSSPERKQSHPAFAGLSEKALNALYSSATRDTLAAGSWLFGPGLPPRSPCLILTGQGDLLSLAIDPPLPLLRCMAGSCLPANAGRNASTMLGFRADGELGVLIIDDQLCNRLDDGDRNLLEHNLARLAAEFSAGLEQRIAGLACRQHTVEQNICHWLQTSHAAHADSTVIRGLLQKIPGLPPYAGKLTTLLLGEQASAREVVEIARQDPSLTGWVLKTVNSAQFALRHKVVDFQHAFMLLGFNRIYQLIMDRNLLKTLPQTAEFHVLQKHSMLVSTLCFEIAQALKLENAALYSTIGLLHDIGQSVVLLLKRQNPQTAFLLNLLDPGMIGTLLLREWQLPEEIAAIPQYLLQAELLPPASLPPEQRRKLVLLRVAHCCLAHMQASPQPRDHVWFSDYLQELQKEPQPGCESPADFIDRQLRPWLQARASIQPPLIRSFLARTGEQDASISNPALQSGRKRTSSAPLLGASSR